MSGETWQWRVRAAASSARRMCSANSCRRFLRSAALSPVLAVLVVASFLHAQNVPKAVIDQDISAFDISAQNNIVYAVPHRHFIKKYILDRDDIFIATANGKVNRIVDSDKFLVPPPIVGYRVNSLSWSPDGKRIALNMTIEPIPDRLEEELEAKHNKHKGKKKRDDQDDDDDDDYQPPPKPALGGSVVALFDDEGHQIQVTGSKSGFIENASNATWLSDDRSVVYMSGSQIMRVRPADGATTKLFEGHQFQAIAWDAARNRAFAIGEDITVEGGMALVELDLLHQSVAPLAQLSGYRSSLVVSPSGTKVGFFENGDTIEVIDVAHPSTPVFANAGLGFFQFGPNERRVLLKRGPEGQSNDLVWVGLHDDSFSPALHDLEYHAFQIAPDGNTVAVTEPGKRVLKIFSLD